MEKTKPEYIREAEAERELRALSDKEFEKMPIIGITGRKGEKNRLCISLAYNAYSQAVADAGGIPIILPIVNGAKVSELSQLVDGLIVTGGEDLNPLRYNSSPKEYTGNPDKDKEDLEFGILENVLGVKPVLAVCAGMHKLNVVYGGSLYQDIAEETGSEINHNNKAERSNGVHKLKIIDKDSIMYSVFGIDEISVNSTHHQAVKDVGYGLIVSGIAPDGIAEAVEDKSQRFTIGVQFHPEALYSKDEFIQNTGFFKKLVEAARYKK